MLSEAQGKLLLSIAKDAIDGKKHIPNKKFLKEKRGVFVTLTIDGRLRGCMGFPYPTKPLGEAVYEAARGAAYGDPRFPPLSDHEKDKIEMEISVLTLPKPVSLDKIKKGDGVILEKDGRGALFLPQVWEQLPDKTAFLSELSLKAGLPPDAYKTAKFKRFSIQSFK